jgi:hypothetical protein
MLYQIDLPYACFGIETDEQGIVINCAPIAHWTRGKKIDKIIEYYKKKGGNVTIIEEKDR